MPSSGAARMAATTLTTYTGRRTFSTGANFFEQISESKFQIITEVVSALFARVGREVLLVTRLEQRYSWPRYPSERPGEGVRDLITIEPEQSGSFFLAKTGIGVVECWVFGNPSRPNQHSVARPAAANSALRGRDRAIKFRYQTSVRAL